MSDELIDIDLSSGDSVETSNGWTREKENFMKKLANKRGALTWLHNQSADYYSNIDFRLGIVLAVCAYLFGVSGIPTLSMLEAPTVVAEANITMEQAQAIADEVAAVKIVNIVIQALVILIGVFETVMLVVGLDDKAKEHKWAAGKSSSLFLDIRKEIKKKRYRRMEADKFIHKILEKDIDLHNESAAVPSRNVRQYYEKFGDRAISYEELFGDSLLMLEIEESDCSEQVVSKALLRATQISTQESHALGIAEERSLEKCIQDHDANEKRRRAVPALSPQQAFDLEKYLNE